MKRGLPFPWLAVSQWIQRSKEESVKRRILLGALVVLVATTLALVAVATGGVTKSSSPKGKQTLPASACQGVTYGGKGKPKYLIASDLPEQGANRPQTTQMSNAIRYLLKTKWHWKAGKYTVGYQECDDATAQAAKWDAAKCRSNASAYVSDKTLLGVVGTFNSGCAKLEVPILNRARPGPVGMVSPANTAVGLTVAGLGANPGEPGIYYPTHVRNYIRVVTRDDIQGPAGAMVAKAVGGTKIYILTDKELYGLGVSKTFQTAAKRLKLKIVGGPEAWDPKASSYETQANKIKASGANAVYLGGIVCNNGAKLVKDLRAVLGSKVKIIGPDGWTPFSAVAKAGTGAEGMYITVPGAPPEALKGAGKTFVNGFRKSSLNPGHKKLASYVAYAAQAADVLMTAIKKSNGTRAATTKNLFKTNVVHGILGNFKIDKNGDTNLRGITAYRMHNGDGKTFKTLYPPTKLTKR
jgi:branched-chain amino acid transport system substrate-binding protein